MFLKVAPEIPNTSGLGQVVMRHPSGRMIRVRMPIALKKRRGVGQIGKNAALALNNGAQRNIPSATPTAVTYASAPGCHVIDLSKNACMADDGTQVGCNLIQECDSLTGNARCQYQYPGVQPDPSLPFCTGSGPSVSYAPNKSLTNPTGPSTAFTPTSVFAANSGVALPATSSARIAAPSASSGGSPAASTPAASGPGSVSSFIQNLFGTATPATPANVNIPVAGAPTSGFDLSFLTNPVDLFGFEIPVWVIGAVVIGGGILLMEHKR